MKKAERIEKYVRETFELYDMDYDYFIDCLGDETGPGPGRIEKAAEALGLDPAALIRMDDAETAKWLDRFSYFSRLPDFRFARESSFHGEDYEALRLYDVFFGTHEAEKSFRRYNHYDIICRMIELLKKIDESMPGTYHQGARITKLRIETENFCHYEEINLLVRDYLEMIDRAQALFFQAWEAELSAEEVREYNFLVNALGIEDRECFSDGPLMYGRLKTYIPVYREEGYGDFFAYVRINPGRVLNAWTCAEFTEYPELMERLLRVCPRAHRMMREFTMLVSKFHCTFTWSDALPIPLSEEEELESALYGDAMGIDGTGGAQRLKMPTFIYVPKTPEEMRGDEVFAERLKILSGPAKQGGVPLPEYETALNDMKLRMARVERRVEARLANGGLAHA